MKTNSELLLDWMKSEPYNETLYCAAIDALTEDGDEQKAEWVQQLMDLEKIRSLIHPSYNDGPASVRAKLRWWLGLTKITAGTPLCVDEYGYVVPVGEEQVSVVAYAAYGPDLYGVVRVRLPEYMNWYIAYADVEVSKPDPSTTTGSYISGMKILNGQLWVMEGNQLAQLNNGVMWTTQVMLKPAKGLTPNQKDS